MERVEGETSETGTDVNQNLSRQGCQWATFSGRQRVKTGGEGFVGERWRKKLRFWEEQDSVRVVGGE